MTVNSHEDDVLMRRLAALQVVGPDPHRMTLLALAGARRNRPLRRARFLLAIPVTVALLLLTGYYVPALGDALADTPGVRPVLGLVGLSDLAQRVTGLDASATSSGVTLRLTGGFADAAGSILLLEHQPGGQLDLTRTSLSDQFGRTYLARYVATDLEQGRSIMVFEPLGGPATITGARLTLVITRVEVGASASELTPREGQWTLTGVLAVGQAREVDRPIPATINGVRFEFVHVRALPSGLQVVMRVSGIEPSALNDRLPDGLKGRRRLQLAIIDASGKTQTPWSLQIGSTGGADEVTAVWISPPPGQLQLRIELVDQGTAVVPIVRR